MPPARAHDPKVLAAFQDGEQRLVYARFKDRPGDPPYYLQDGTARTVRDWAKQHLECFMPECANRRLTTVSRTGKRDGFSHFHGAGGHGREGLFHQQAKALIVRWLTARYPALTVVAEQSTASGTRRADVMVTGPAGAQVAIEVQYHPLTVAKWRERHQSYRDQGVTAVWLLGHLPPHLRAARYGDPAGHIELGVLHTAMLEAGVTPLWINPITEQIGACWSLGLAHECLSSRCTVDHNRLPTVPIGPTSSSFPGPPFGADPLEECVLHPDGLHTPTTRWLADCDRRYRQARHADRQRQQEALAARRAAKQAREQQAARAEAERPRFEARARSYQRALEQRWLLSDLRASVGRRYGTVPEVLSADPADGYAMLAHPEHWRAALYVDLVLDRPSGTTFTVGDCYRVLGRHGIQMHPDVQVHANAIITFLKRLAVYEVVRMRHDRNERRRVREVTVLADIETAAERQQAARHLREAEEATETARIRELRKAEAAETARIRARWASRATEARSSGTTFTPTPAPPPRIPSNSRTEPADRASQSRRRYTHCRRCGLPLAEALAADGHHIGC